MLCNSTTFSRRGILKGVASIRVVKVLPVYKICTRLAEQRTGKLIYKALIVLWHVKKWIEHPGRQSVRE